ncbi:MAG TPA: sodium-dependent transporter [Sutterella sp.]|nr:sodium-dependent transporter [Sutterella sp.]
MASKRESWGNNFGFLMAAIGSAVGLGNIWGFPYKMGANGGFAFLIVYLILALLLGFVVMLAELSLGRKSGLGCIGAYQKLSKRFKWVGWLGVLSAFLIMSFYTVLGAYCLKYMVINFGDMFGAAFGSASKNGGEIFGALITSPWESIVYTIVFIALTYVIVVGGIEKGIEKFSTWAMPALFVMLLVVIVRSVTLDGAGEGLAFMFAPNFKPFEENFIGVLAAASGQLFFSLSLGMAIMITYGSYMKKDEDIEKNAAIIVISDTVVAILAGVAVIPAAFALGGEGAALAGPKLLFITLQNVFHAMGAMGPIIGVIFYALVVIAAVTSSISLTETIVTYFLDRDHVRGKEMKRRTYTLWICLAITAEAIVVAADGLGANGMWVPFQDMFGVKGWNDCWLDFMDALSEGFMMPVGALMTCLFIGYEMGIKEFGKEVRASGHAFRTEALFGVCCKYIAPVILVFVLYNQLKGFGLL